jgi:ADP-ribose pyrophosphatase
MHDGIDVHEHRICHAGFLTLARYRLRHRLYGGGWSELITRERIEHLNSAAILLYDPSRDQVVMVEQFRIGALECGPGAWVVEPPGGVVAAGEDPATVAVREAREETGCLVTDVQPIASFHVSPGVAAERIHLFCGRTDATSAGGIHGLASEGEDIRVLVLDAPQALDDVRTGRMDTMTAIIALQWLELNRPRLRAIWCPECVRPTADRISASMTDAATW